MEETFLRKMRNNLLTLKKEILRNLASESEDFRTIIEDMDPKDLADVAADDIDRMTLEALGWDSFFAQQTGGDALAEVVGSLPVSFAAPDVGSTTHALGYSYSDDPNFMYCAENMGTEGEANWWLPNCGLSGGSSGGPWVQPMNTSTGSGNIISVNSWGYSTQPGMAGPKLNGTSALCIFNVAQSTTFESISTGDGNAGVAVGSNICP